MTIIKKATVDIMPPGVWHKWFLNIRCDATPEHDVYDVKEFLYFSEKEGWVSFHAYRGPDRGFGGAVFRTPVRQPDGSITIEDHIGPWSSNSAHASRLFKPCMEIHVHTDKYSNLAGHCTTQLAKEVIRTFGLPYKVCECLYGNERDRKPDGWRLFPSDMAEGHKFDWAHWVGKEA